MLYQAAWAPYFEEANAIIFVVSMGVFDQPLAEDPSVNRLVRSHVILIRALAHPVSFHR